MPLTDSTRKKTYLNKYDKYQKVTEVKNFNFKDFNKYKKRVYQGGESVKKVFPGGYSIMMLERFRKLIEKGK